MQKLKDILVFTRIILYIAVFALAFIATYKGWLLTAFFSWMAILANAFLTLPTDGGMGSYDSDF